MRSKVTMHDLRVCFYSGKFTKKALNIVFLSEFTDVGQSEIAEIYGISKSALYQFRMKAMRKILEFKLDFNENPNNKPDSIDDYEIVYTRKLHEAARSLSLGQ